MKTKHPIKSDGLGSVAIRLAKEIEASSGNSGVVAIDGALRRLLEGGGEDARELRTMLMIHLAVASNEWDCADGPGVDGQERMLSTEEAARMMGCSRPHVAMLADAGQLAGAIRSKGGHRKIPVASVLKWVDSAKDETASSTSDSDYRKAACDGGLYAIPEEIYAEAGKRTRSRARKRA